ncbi:MAG: hydrogenase expression/formation protein HypE [Candidatus Omnitrophota bacterium]|jgi:hydrogenase expression/formation protein HypE|nr:MAG: hydrogenase expression/formation protein HypE [Candidatus Omnitrophota bacterium]
MADKIRLAHGGGGVLMRELIEEQIGPALGGLPQELPDAAPIPHADGFVMTTDSFVVKPLFFKGGDIGSLAVHGTINDLAVSGAQPLALSLALIIEEGLDIDELKKVLRSTGDAVHECGIRIITGDTKVVARGEADELFINTAGVGKIIKNVSSTFVQEGDCVLINGSIAEHGIAVMSSREGLRFDTPIASDSASIWPLVKALLDEDIEIHAMRDPTRGGLAACCVEIADAAGCSIELEEKSIPIRAEVVAACEMLGLDPLMVANEGKLVAFLPKSDAQKAVNILHKLPNGENAVIIGHVIGRKPKSVYLQTRWGGRRIIEMPYGEELPRIC